MDEIVGDTGTLWGYFSSLGQRSFVQRDTDDVWGGGGFNSSSLERRVDHNRNLLRA